MDGERFDAWTRQLDISRTRRGLLGAVLVALSGQVLEPEPVGARKRRQKRRRQSGSRCIDCADRAVTRSADLKGCDLTGRDLSAGNLRAADLAGACLQGANLAGADLRSADLEGADVRGANFTDANLDRADIRGWKASDAVFCRTTMPNGAINSGNCPPGAGNCIPLGDVCIPGLDDRCCGQGACLNATCQCPEPLHSCDGVCRECCADSDCGDATPHCCAGICRGCCENADCALGQRCQAKRCICDVLLCREAGGCCAGTVCDLDAARWSPQTTFGSGPGSGDDEFSGPFGVAIDADGRTVWVAERGNARISVWTYSGGRWANQTTFGSAGSGPNEFDTAIDVAASADGQTVWVADIQNHRISVWHKQGGVWSNQTTFGSGPGSEPSQFKFPEGVAVSNNGKTVWVADSGNARISVWTESGGSWSNQTTFGSKGSGPGEFSLPSDVAVSGDGRTAWVTDAGLDRVSIWTESGGVWSFQTTFGSTGSGPGRLDNPGYLHVSANGLTVWVSELNNNRVSVWKKSGSDWVNETTFGSRGSDPNEFDAPNGVVASANGRTVWVADTGNQRISIWESDCPSS
jgi:DNA-binding beta-propeller fold protein YncE